MKHLLRTCFVMAALLVCYIPLETYGVEPRVIAVASDDGDTTSVVGAYPARSRYYLLFSGITMVEVLKNPFLDKGAGAGPLIVDYLAQKGVAILVAGGFGPPMIEAMNKKGMKYFQFSGVAQEAVERVMSDLKPAEKKDGE